VNVLAGAMFDERVLVIRIVRLDAAAGDRS
jgi:hypothetical protein